MSDKKIKSCRSFVCYGRDGLFLEKDFIKNSDKKNFIIWVKLSE